MSTGTAAANSLTCAELQKINEAGQFQDQVDFIDKKIRYLICDYKQKRNQSRDCSARLKKLTLIFGALVTLFLAVKEFPPIQKYQIWFTLVALILSTVMTGITAWEAFADYRWKWIRYRTTLSTLYGIRDDFHFKRAKQNGQLSEADINNLHERVQIAITETNEEWMSQRGNALRPSTAAPAGQTAQ